MYEEPLDEPGEPSAGSTSTASEAFTVTPAASVAVTLIV